MLLFNLNLRIFPFVVLSPVVSGGVEVLSLQSLPILHTRQGLRSPVQVPALVLLSREPQVPVKLVSLVASKTPRP